MAELRAGGLALVINSTKPEQVGMVVTLLKLVYPGRFTLNGKEYCAKANSPVWLCEKPEAYVTYYPWQLMPIDGDDFSNEDEHQKEREHA
ncbi:hypothetical protein EDF73_113157 [Raoultella sp. BIGb0138]|uniref:hypothetical protein n=1 Tax=Raoultella sp. BIGb0138 TaxID=2485115 RepID=UPI0010518E33|nr:hypothetical protein [Raoultella sp. BIGb0138]TCW07095.1 hypothetical protein EDF73_113157 [Raoultella sp. BIGb0138]